MFGPRARTYRARIMAELRRSFGETYTPRQIAGSFAIGVFITMLPTLGTGLILFVVISYLSDWVNKVAMFASVLVLNPVVKWGVYAASLALGFLLLGPVEVGVTAQSGRDTLIRLLVGNTILAIAATVIAYVVVHRLATAYQEQAKAVVDVVVEEIEEDLGADSTPAGSD